MHGPCRRWQRLALVALFLVVGTSPVAAQRFGRGYRGPGTVSNVKWSADGQAVFFTSQEQRFRLDLDSLTTREVEEDAPEAEASQQPTRNSGRPGSYSTNQHRHLCRSPPPAAASTRRSTPPTANGKRTTRTGM